MVVLTLANFTGYRGAVPSSQLTEASEFRGHAKPVGNPAFTTCKTYRTARIGTRCKKAF